MGLEEKILRELDKNPRRLKELKGKFGNNKKVAKIIDELYHARVIQCRQGMYSIAKIDNAKAKNAVECTIVKLGRGFGFAKPEDGSIDVFIPGKFLMGAVTGDVVMVSIFENPRVKESVEGEVIAVIHKKKDFVGTVLREEGKLMFFADSFPQTPISLKKGSENTLKNRDKVAVEIISRGLNHKDHVARIVMRFGSSEKAAQCAQAVLYSSGITTKFSNYVKQEAAKIATDGISEEEIAQRKDLRNWDIFTIDAASTKDIDDAVSATKKENGTYELGVHIADVSHYVKQGMALDGEAMKRGTSVYYADSVVPMLPKELSNGLCSLNEKETRLAFSCIMQLDKNANVTDFSFVKTVICSKIKGVYSELNAIYDNSADNALLQKYAEVKHVLPVLNEIYEKRAAQRASRGAMEIESGEAKLILNENGICTDVVKRTRGLSEQMIEELMLLANECAATLARKMEIPFVYRVHEEPSFEKIDTLKEALTSAGVNFKFANEVPMQTELAQLLNNSRNTPLERFVHTAILRSMAKAKYEAVPKGHFGLALADYSHFTSPIRRYPDLAIHRILTDVCKGEGADTLTKKYQGYAAGASLQSSECEVIAMQAERTIDDCYKAEYMKQFIGEEFDGVISSVTSFGIYVELPSTVEGLIRASALSQRPMILTKGVCLADTISGKKWRLGDSIRVLVSGVDIPQGNIDFEPAE